MSAFIVNFFAGPGAGKSTTASGAFYNLKKEGVNCEFVHEFAKELAWENRLEALQDQIYILGNQMHMLNRCMMQVDAIITDTSILLGIIYARKYHQSPYPKEFEALVLSAFRHMNNINYFVERKKAYNPTGRYQDETDALALDNEVRDALNEFSIPYTLVPGDEWGVQTVVEDIKKCLERGSTLP